MNLIPILLLEILSFPKTKILKLVPEHGIKIIIIFDLKWSLALKLVVIVGIAYKEASGSKLSTFVVALASYIRCQ